MFVSPEFVVLVSALSLAHPSVIGAILRHIRPVLACAAAALVLSLPVAAAVPDAERQILVDLYHSTNGDGWTDKNNWLVGDPCENDWWAISCNADETRVTQIGLSGNNLTGVLPATLNQLTALEYITFSVNQLTGPIPPLSGLTSLQHFRAWGNRLSGVIPSLDGLGALRTFHAGGNQLTGPIPPLTGLPSLHEISVYDNQLSGPIPSFAELPALHTFNANDNRLTAIPPLAEVAALEYFLVRNNQLSGTIPPLAGLQELLSFDVGNNNLSGPIPLLTGLSKLRYFDIGENQLSGPVPPLTDLVALRNIYIHDNRITGPVPPALPSLLQNGSSLCPNHLARNDDAAWDVATGTTPWHSACTDLSPSADTVTPIPTLGESTLMLMSLLAAGLGMRRLRHQGRRLG